MIWMLLREVSWRHARHAPLRSVLVVFGIALGVSMCSAVLATQRSLTASFEEMVQGVVGKTDLIVTGGTTGIPSSLVSEIVADHDVAHVAPALEVLTHIPGDPRGPILVLAVDFLGDTFFSSWSDEAGAHVVSDPLAFVNDPTAILLTTSLAQERGLAVGDAIRLVSADSDKTFHVRGLIEPKGPAAAFGGQVAVMFLDAAQLSFARGDTVDRIDIAARSAQAVPAVWQRLRARLAGRVDIDRPLGHARRLEASLEIFRGGLNLSAMVAVLVGMFLIYNAVSVSVAQRRREVGVLRALGATKRTLVRLFCAEALLMSSIGVVVGLVLAKLLARIALASIESTISEVVFAVRPPPPVISVRIAVSGAAVGLLSTLLAAYLPARRASLVEPAEAVRSTRASALIFAPPVGKLGALGIGGCALSLLLAQSGGVTTGYAALAGLLLGSALLVPSCVVVLKWLLVKAVERSLGIPGRLALDNVERALGRSAMAVCALMLAVAMSLSIAAYATSFENSVSQWADDAFPADAMITKGSPIANRHAMAFLPSTIEPALQLDGIAGVNPVRLTYHEVGGRRIQLSASDTRVELATGGHGRRRRVLAGPTRLASSALVTAPRALISENMANLLRLSPGDSVRLATPEGERSFEVYAVVVDYSSDQGWMQIDRRWYEAYWKDQRADSVNLHFAAGSDETALIRRIRAKLGTNDSLFVTSHQGLREHLLRISHNVFAIARAPELIAFAVAIMGVLGTMLSTVLDRVPEIGSLRAIGASARQIVWSVVAESGFLGLSSVVCGVLSGIPQGYVLLRVISRSASGWSLSYCFPFEAAVRTALVVVAAAACAGILPGRRASQLDVKTALSYE
jgi:putative ABC transport system permease protein